MPKLSTIYRKHREKSRLLEKLEREMQEERLQLLEGMKVKAQRETGLRNFSISSKFPGLEDGTLYWVKVPRRGCPIFVTLRRPNWTVEVTANAWRLRLYSREFKTPEGAFRSFCKQLNKVKGIQSSYLPFLTPKSF